MAACSVCGAVSDDDRDGDPPLAWTYEVDAAGRPRWTCPACTRANARSIEAKLDQEWW